MLTPEQKATLQMLHEGRRPEDDTHIPTLIEGSYVIERGGQYHLTESGLKELGELRLARGFGEAIADTIVPGVGSKNSLRD